MVFHNVVVSLPLDVALFTPRFFWCVLSPMFKLKKISYVNVMTKQSKPYISPVVYCLCYFINVTITVTLKSRQMIIYIGFLFNIGIGILSTHQKIGRQRACLTSWQLNRVHKCQQRRIYEIRCDLQISINNLISVRVMSFFLRSVFLF